MSYYIASIHPKKFKYVLNDLNEDLIRFYNVLQDPYLYQRFLLHLEVFQHTNNKLTGAARKSNYNHYTRTQGYLSYFIGNRYYNFRPFVCPIDKPFIIDFKQLEKMVNFLRTEDVSMTEGCGISCMREYEDADALILLDPPYMETDNSFYVGGGEGCSIYQYLYKYDINRGGNICLVVEDTWLIHKLYENYKRLSTYSKTYHGYKKKTVDHCVILF
jgi:site-specific DNA-adenine methylase